MFGIMKKLMKPRARANSVTWQRHWHNVLNDYPNEENVPINSLEELPDFHDDLRLHFMLWRLGPEARKRAISIFPRHRRILARIERHLADRPSPIDAEAATILLRKGLRVLHDIGIQAPKPDAPVRILTEEQIPLLDAFKYADTPFRELYYQIPKIISKTTGDIGRDTYFFLHEPLYRLSNNYDVVEWITWPLCQRRGAADPTEAAYHLCKGGWSSGDGEDLFLFDRRSELT